MITGIGTDLVEIARVQKAIGRSAFLRKVYTEREQELIAKRSVRSAGNFAAKEAVAKALGCGFSGIRPIEIEVLRDVTGMPYVVLHGRAKQKAAQKGITRVHISITDTEQYAQAYAICETEENRYGSPVPLGREHSVSFCCLEREEYRLPVFDAKGIREVDRITIEEMGIPSVVLMERAALAVTECVEKYVLPQGSIAVLCGTGNNGGDGLAVARMLKEAGYDVTVLIKGASNPEKAFLHATEEFLQQLTIAKAVGVPVQEPEKTVQYEVIVDALFGVGLTRPIEGDYAILLERLNKESHIVVAVDIPSGVNASTGKVEGVALAADETVTFGGVKCGHMLYPGKEYCGRVTVADIGFSKRVLQEQCAGVWYCPERIEELLPKRPAASNKGTFGKIAVIAGKKNMAGAAYFSAAAAYRTGAGLVKVITPECNREILQNLLPEAMLSTYESTDNIENIMEETLDFADAFVIGPGLGTEGPAERVVFAFCDALKHRGDVPVTVWDADALNILAARMNGEGLESLEERCAYLEQLLPDQAVLTPHPGEAARLFGCGVGELTEDFPETAKKIGACSKITVVLKDAVTLVVAGEKLFMNSTGNNGMSTGGSGDVLTGMIAALAAAGLESFEAASAGVWLHGAAGDAASMKQGAVSVIARDLLFAIGELFAEKGEEKENDVRE